MIFFKLPFQKKIFTTDENSLTENISFTDFNGNENLVFQGNFKEINDFSTAYFQNFSSLNLIKNSTKSEESKQEYLNTVENIIDDLKINNLKKLVYSRRKIINFNTINLIKSYQNLCENYPNAFCYLFLKDENCWMGAFSEILGKFNKKTAEFETMSLAGTLSLDESWTEKEMEEQQTVTDYVFDILKNYDLENSLKKSEIKDHISGNIKHLRTNFSLKINKKKLDGLIAALHPTPAVCGIPKEICEKAIANFEKYPRELYAGYSKIDTEEIIYYFVNLRCAKIFKNSAHLFVGGGITQNSTPEKEWQETELKSEAILKNLVIS